MDKTEPGRAGSGGTIRRRETRTREALLNAGRNLMAAPTRESFTVDDVVQAARVAKGSFYNHFEDKAALSSEIYSLIRDKEERLIADANRTVTDPALRIAQGMAGYALFALTAPDEARLIIGHHADNIFLDNRSNAGLVRDLSEGLVQGRLVFPTIEAAALLVLGQTGMLVSRIVLLGRGSQAEALTQQCLALTLLGLGLDHREAHLLGAQAVLAILAKSACAPSKE